MRVRREIATSWCVVVLGGMLVASIASGQGTCVLHGDDGFDIGCCVPPTPNISVVGFPVIVMDGVGGNPTTAYAGIGNCSPFNQSSPKLLITPPSFPYCDYGVSQVAVAFLSGESFGGTLYMKYARTWLDGLASQTQVWRFLVNGDLVCQGPPTTGCASVLPPCWLASPLGPGIVHWDGHIDYACTNGTWSESLSLNHHRGLYSHHPASCAFIPPGVDHLFESYHLVGPAPFTFGNPPPPAGPLVADSVRRSILIASPPSYSCMSEIHLQLAGSLTTLTNLPCLPNSACQACPSFGSCEYEQSLTGLSCPGPGLPMSFFSIPTGPPLPLTTGFVAITIGQWPFLPLPTVYPWSSTLTLYLGTILAFPDPCAAPMNSFHVVTGVSTAYEPPFQANLFNSGACTCGSLPISHSCIDLNNVLLTGTGFMPGYGCLAASDLVLNLNLYP